MPQRQQTSYQPSLEGTLRYLREKADSIQQIQQFTPLLDEPDGQTPIGDPSQPAKNPIYDTFKDVLKLLTGFTEQKILDFAQRCQPYWMKHRKRGAPPKVSQLDSIIALLTLYKSGGNGDTLASQFDLASSTFNDTIKRTRPVMYEMLYDYWWKNKKRPKPLSTTNFPYIAAAGDSTTIEVHHPWQVRFEDAKHYFDSKNWCYGLKKEVLVATSEPHIALFASKGTVGSEHDYQRLKESYIDYSPYFVKMDEERLLLPFDSANRSWATVWDTAYGGPDSDTPDFRRIAIKKAPQTQLERQSNQELAKIRVVVEQFFGRLYLMWGMFRGVYRWSHEHFDQDFDICAMLTNEDIVDSHQLTENDYEFYRKVLQTRKEHWQKKRDKKKAQQEAYVANKRRRSQLGMLLC